jgi:hypothetical protein
MAISTNFNINPYYDDLDEDKKFLRLLYKPGYAVQARELTQAQSIVQKQVERFGNHIFKNGSVVSGGQVFLQDVPYINLVLQYASTDLVIADFEDKVILSNDETKRAQVLVAVDATTNTPHTLLISEIYGTSFASGETNIKTIEPGGDAFAFRANIAASGTGTGQVFSVNSGVYYYEGFFVKVDQQSIPTSIYNNNTANVKIGFEISESIVESVDDTSLLDPAQGASNFQAPGSDRFKIELVLSSRSLDSTDLSNFIELAQIKEGVLQKITRNPIYSNIEETLARRTYDESGDYVVKPFLLDLKTNSANSANLDITLSQGKAYVKGYEFTSIAPVTITIPKPRNTISIPSRRITADYGNFVYSTNHFRHLPFQVLGQVDIHCVPNTSVSMASGYNYNNTKIGTARVTQMTFDTNGGATSCTSSYIYRTHLTDINVSSIIATVNCAINSAAFGLGNSIGGASSTTTSSLDNAYTGAKIRIVSGPGAGEIPRTITTYNGTTKNCTVTPAFLVAPTTASVFAIDFEIKDAESFVEPVTISSLASAVQSNSSADIHPFSKDLASTYENVFVSEKSNQPLLIKLGEDFVVQNSISSFNYEYFKFKSGLNFTSLQLDLGPHITGGTEQLSGGGTVTTRQENFLIKTNETSGSYVAGQVIPATDYTVAGTTLTLNGVTYTGAVNIFYSVATTAGAKTKTYANANVIVQTQESTYSIFANNNAYVWPDKGQTHLNRSLVTSYYSQPMSLFVSDVVGVNAIFDLNGTWPITQGALAGASNVTSRFILNNGQNDTYYDHASIQLRLGETPPVGPLLIRYDRYIPETSSPGYFTVDSYLAGHNNNTLANRVAYETLPIHTSNDASNYFLRDHFDFRPVRLDAAGTNRSTYANTKIFGTVAGTAIPQNGSDIIASYQNYLPRVDKIGISKSRQFEIITGQSAIKPAVPTDKEDCMSIYTLFYTPFVEEPKFIRVVPIANKRYTMKDIGVMEKRIENLEYYTSLSLLELETSTKSDFSILDSANLPRFKNGFIVDGFTGSSVSNVLDTGFKASVDRSKRHLRPTYDLTPIKMYYDPTDGDNTRVNRLGPIFTVDFEEVSYVKQPYASRTENINPFNVINFLGKITLDPPSDNQSSQSRQADLTVDIGGDREAWKLLTDSASKTEWGEWYQVGSPEISQEILGGVDGWEGAWKNTAGKTTAVGYYVKTAFYTFPAGSPSAYAGRTVQLSTGIIPGFTENSPPAGFTLHNNSATLSNANKLKPETWAYWLTTGGANDLPKIPLVRRNSNAIDQSREVNVSVTTKQSETRTGVKYGVSSKDLSSKLGDRIIDLSLVSWMREKAITFKAEGFKPSTQLFAFFDNTAVTKYVVQANKFFFVKPTVEADLTTVTNSIKNYKTKLTNQERITFKNNVLGTSNGTANLIMTSGFVGYTKDDILTSAINTPQTGGTLSLIGQTSTSNVIIEKFEHYTGKPAAVPSSDTTLQLSLMATGADNCTTAGLVGQLITIVNGPGIDQVRTISAYDSSTRTVTVSEAWSVLPTTSSVYGIGRPTTDTAGGTAGIFYCPENEFKVGEKLFRLIDDSSGNIEASRTNGDARFISQGLLSTVQDTNLISTVPSNPTRENVNDNRDTTTTSIKQETQNKTVCWTDPLSQTFLVNPQLFPNGLYVSKVRLSFATKDPTVPVTLELRPTNNGYPSSSVVYPLGTVTLTPEKINITSSPDLVDATKYTDFEFDSPIYLKPGEHCFVVVSNSKLYNVYVAEKGKTNLADNNQISSDQYIGSLFLSQNGSTWTAEQNLDMQFEIFRHEYSSEPSQVVFKAEASQLTSNVVFDVAHLMSTDIALPKTSVSYLFNSEKSPNGGMTGYIPIVPNEDYELNDTYGRRVVNPNTGDGTFKVVVTLSSLDSALSPCVDSTRMNLLAIENKINNLPLSNSLISIANTGTTGTLANGIFVVDSSTGLGNTQGSSAILKIETTDGKINRVWVSNGGSGYIDSPTINLYAATAETATMGSGATAYTGKLIVDQALANSIATSVLINGETSAYEGPADARYIMRTVTLADGFDSGDLRVYLTAYKPTNSNIYVYYKLLSISDPTPFQERGWQLMTQINNFNYTSSFVNDFRELVYAPGYDGVANNTVLYASNGTTFNNFKTFAIKIVMAGTDTTNVPKLKDLRVIALPEGS